MSDNEKSSSDLERDVEARRSDVNDTINTLKNRFSPEAVADYGLNYMRGPGGERMLGAVRENPLAALLVVGGLGWLFYTANQPEDQRRRHPLRSGTPYPRPMDTGEPTLRESDLSLGDDVGLGSTGMPTTAASTTTPTRVSTGTSSTARVYESPQSVSHPGMMGDGTEEQNLNQPGNPSARIREDEVDAAFGKGRTDLP